VLDDAGRLLESVSVRTDAEIKEFLDRHVATTLVAAIDAPLVVPNEAGRRPCEALVGKSFARFGAGAYPANRSNPNFFPEPRGARLAAEMGWDMDPSTVPGIDRRVCIEVYPHPAMVSLFPLSYVIPYKLKRGRELPALKNAYGQLLDHLEATCGTVLRLPASLRHLRCPASGMVGLSLESLRVNV
jgi:predicted RNase H-like nuclease